MNKIMSASTTRRKFLELLGLTAGATIAGATVFGKSTPDEEILTLNAEEQEFMLMYERWMDEFLKVIKIQKDEPHNMDNHKRMMALTEIADEWKTQINTYMQDKKFATIYHASVERMKKEIQNV
ncbi:MAG: hypothetical protein K1X81_01315 [Bacteroidia bacterium]|nr:hypothetical protein [Bacteroidia bacterium]